MKIGNCNKMPMWARFLAILLGIPLFAALLRVGLERKFDRLTALALLTIVLLILWFVLRRMFASHPDSVPTSREDKKREFSKFQGVVFAVFAVFMLVGTAIGFYAAFAADSGPVWSRIACGGIGFIGLLLAFIFIIGSVQGFMRLTTRWSQRPPRR
jgi:uncharacterized membrane protein